MEDDAEFEPLAEFMERPVTRAELWRVIYRQNRVNLALVDAVAAACESDSGKVADSLRKLLDKTSELTSLVDRMVSGGSAVDE